MSGSSGMGARAPFTCDDLEIRESVTCNGIIQGMPFRLYHAQNHLAQGHGSRATGDLLVQPRFPTDDSVVVPPSTAIGAAVTLASAGSNESSRMHQSRQDSFAFKSAGRYTPNEYAMGHPQRLRSLALEILLTTPKKHAKGVG